MPAMSSSTAVARVVSPDEEAAMLENSARSTKAALAPVTGAAARDRRDPRSGVYGVPPRRARSQISFFPIRSAM
jgi:hypothetical protein